MADGDGSLVHTQQPQPGAEALAQKIGYSTQTTAESLWKGLATTYNIKRDSAQIFELTVQANSIKQGQGSIENFYSTLQRIWAEIDENHPNPMECEKDIETYWKIQSKTQLFQLFAGVSEKYEPERRDILKLDPLPNVEAAYALIREIGSGHVTHHDSEALGMAAKGFRPPNRSGQPLKNGDSGGSSSQDKIDKSKLKCSQYRMIKHTKETCFRLVGYPEWWEDNHTPPKDNHGKAAIGVGNTEITNTQTDDDAGRGSGGSRSEKVAIVAKVLSDEERGGVSSNFNFEDTGSGYSIANPPILSPLFNLQNRYNKYLARAHVISNKCRDQLKNDAWIFDCGATDTMTTGEIIGHGTERQGLYYVDEIAQKCYRCYDPKSRRMFTTMNCDFPEIEFFYHHHFHGQGKSPKIDPLSWLPNPNSLLEAVLTETVNRTAETVSETSLQSTEFSEPDSAPPNLVSEV
ncbi:hypothetical protein C2S53_007787 [Perilla frutescens var. hirtella]|uniref:Uncharacterized protein n=1 Tax=Perilla frutescens var. hirtella TaxID=608512 RepID=A0AAD4P1A1_PERFH|nr:hypothetical protein C2S53_007787 [Perilla frutescens var. hirtella]